MDYANLLPSANFFLSREKVFFYSVLLHQEEKGGRTMEMATDEPTPTASQQELSGSNSGHLTVDYDSEDANYRAQVDGQKGAGVRRVGGLTQRFTLSVEDDNKFRALCE